MNDDLLTSFDAWVTEAEKCVIRVDGTAIERLQREGALWLERFAEPAVAQTTRQQARDRLERYRSLCAFLQRSLQDALLQACSPPGAGYRPGTHAPTSAVVTRYG